MKKVIIYTDGSCETNPGPGGWAAILTYGVHQREICGGVPATTNNRMELQAAIEGLRALKEPCKVEIYTDSQYLRNGIIKWLPSWKEKGWRTSKKKSVKNEDLWRQLDDASSGHAVIWHWIRGHSGNTQNERCDYLAQHQVKMIKEQYSVEQLDDCLIRFKKKEKS